MKNFLRSTMFTSSNKIMVRICTKPNARKNYMEKIRKKFFFLSLIEKKLYGKEGSTFF